MGRGPWPGSFDAAEELSGGTRTPSRSQRRQERSSGRQTLGDGTASGKDQVQGMPGNEGPRGMGRRRVKMRTGKARVLVSHLCGC